MANEALQILRSMQEVDASGGDAGLLARFRQELWPMQVWIAGSRTELPDDQVSFQMRACEIIGNDFPLLDVFLSEAEMADRPDEHFAANFSMLSLLAESQRIDVLLKDGEEELLLGHDSILGFRDMVRLESGAGVPMDNEEVVALSRAVHRFASEAAAYCRQASDIKTLHLAVLGFPDTKPLLLGKLAAARPKHHIEALTRLSREYLRPAWRFSLVDASRAGPANHMLGDIVPYYDRSQPPGWWARFKHKYIQPREVPWVLAETEATDQARVA